MGADIGGENELGIDLFLVASGAGIVAGCSTTHFYISLVNARLTLHFANAKSSLVGEPIEGGRAVISMPYPPVAPASLAIDLPAARILSTRGTLKARPGAENIVVPGYRA
jgi:hypothetical protein